MSSERRSSYRDSPSSNAAVRVEVSGERGRALGRVKDLSLTGAAVQISAEQTTAFVSGEKVTLLLHFQQGRPVHVEAIVRTQTEMEGFWQYGFAFLTPSAIRAKLPASLLRAFNERAAFRVEPDVPVAVELCMSNRGFRVPGHMRDISFDGLGVVVHDEAGAQLAPGLDVSAEFRLPGQDRFLICEALIRNRRTLKKGVVLLGLRFNRKSPSSVGSHFRDVTEYVMTRQRQWLQDRIER